MGKICLQNNYKTLGYYSTKNKNLIIYYTYVHLLYIYTYMYVQDEKVDGIYF